MTAPYTQEELHRLVGWARDIACPACKAPPGQWCPGNGVHQARIAVYIVDESVTVARACEGIDGAC